MSRQMDGHGMRRLGLWCFAVLISAAGFGCGGGGGAVSGQTSAATISAAADAHSLAWNAAASIDVLANDSASHGTISLLAVSAPSHGSTQIVGGKVVYTPLTGYFGTDSVTYQVRADSGGASTSAVLTLTVNASLVIKGVVADGPLANAAVTASVGGADFAATADAAGTYAIQVQSSDPSALVRLEAVGIGGQGRVRLQARVGVLADLVPLLSATGELTTAQSATTQISHYSTALVVLLSQGNAAQLPATQAAWDAAIANVSIAAVIDIATAIRLVADHGIAFPAGFVDTVALAGNPASLKSFLEARMLANGPQYAAARQAVLTDIGPSVDLKVAVTAPQTLVYFTGSGPAAASLVEVVTFNPGGSMTVSMGDGTYAGQWSKVNGDLKVALDVPYGIVVDTPEIDPATGFNVQELHDTTAFLYRHLTGPSASGLVVRHATVKRSYLNGPKSGTVDTISDENTPGIVLKSADLAHRLPLTAAEFPAGARWGGLVFTDAFDFGPVRDYAQVVLQFDSGSTAQIEGGGTTTWSVADNWLVTTAPGMTLRRYARLSVDPISAEERWLALDESNGATLRAFETSIIRANDVPPQVSALEMARIWRSAVVTSRAGNEFSFALFANGTASQTSSIDTVTTTFAIDSWVVDSTGNVVLTRAVTASRSRERTWMPLKRVPGGLWVLEVLRDTELGDTWLVSLPRLNLLTDLGPAPP